MATEFPEPTHREALALIVGMALFWFFWAVAVVILFIDGSPIGVLPFFCGFVSIGWLYFGGAFRIAARAQGISVTRFYLGSGKTQKDAWKLLMPPYLRRAIAVLGWPVAPVFVVLGLLLVTDLVVFMVMMATTPANR